MSIALQTRSAFKYLLAGLVLSLLVINSQALPARSGLQSRSLANSGSNDLEARARGGPLKKNPGKPAPKKTPAKASAAKKPPAKAPSKKAPAKKAPGKKAPAKKPVGKVLAKKPAGKKRGNACPVKKPAGKKPAGKKTKRSLYRRDLTSHPSAATSFTMFHGVSKQGWADDQKTRIDLSMTNKYGDYHKRGGACDGGFYLTDSLFAAAQFICHHQVGHTVPPKTAYVNEYRWTPPANLKRKAYAKAGDDINDDAEKQCKTHDLIEGPMDSPIFDVNLHKDFYQYAITNQPTVAGLAFVEQYTIPCTNVASGKQLDPALYQHGQRSNANFGAFANQLEGKC